MKIKHAGAVWEEKKMKFEWNDKHEPYADGTKPDITCHVYTDDHRLLGQMIIIDHASCAQVSRDVMLRVDVPYAWEFADDMGVFREGAHPTIHGVEENTTANTCFYLRKHEISLAKAKKMYEQLVCKHFCFDYDAEMSFFKHNLDARKKIMDEAEKYSKKIKI